MTFLSQLEVNLRGGSSPSSFDPNNVRKVITMISLRSGKKIDSHMGAHDLDLSSPSCLTPSSS